MTARKDSTEKPEAERSHMRKKDSGRKDSGSVQLNGEARGYKKPADQSPERKLSERGSPWQVIKKLRGYTCRSRQKKVERKEGVVLTFWIASLAGGMVDRGRKRDE